MASNGDQEDFLLDDSNELLATTEDASDSLLGTDTPDAQEDANFPEGGEEAEAEAAGTDDADATGAGDEAEADPELEEIRARVAEMEAEAEKLKEMHMEVEKQMSIGGSSTTSSFSASTSLNLNQSLEDKMEADARSIYIGNVDYGSTAEELEAHFHGCGSINRVTIQCDRFTGHPKGFAYIEFADKDSVVTATALDDSLFRGRQIKVVPKRTNRPGISSTNRPPRGRGRGRGRSSYYYGSRGYRPYSRRPRRSNWFSPY